MYTTASVSSQPAFE